LCSKREGEGFGFDKANRIVEARRHDIHNRFNVICVSPEYDYTPWYGDHPTDLALAQESYLIKAVIPMIEERFPVIEGPDAAALCDKVFTQATGQPSIEIFPESETVFFNTQIAAPIITGAGSGAATSLRCRETKSEPRPRREPEPGAGPWLGPVFSGHSFYWGNVQSESMR